MATEKAIIGALVGALVALAAALGIVAMFTSFAEDTNAAIREQCGTSSYLEQVAALQQLHRDIAEEGGLQGFLASRVLANAGLGYPQANRPATRVWVYAAAAGAAIGAVAAVLRMWAIPLVLAVAAWGLTSSQSPVASTTILLAGAAGGAVALVIVEAACRWLPANRPHAILAGHIHEAKGPDDER